MYSGFALDLLLNIACSVFGRTYVLSKNSKRSFLTIFRKMSRDQQTLYYVGQLEKLKVEHALIC